MFFSTRHVFVVQGRRKHKDRAGSFYVGMEFLEELQEFKTICFGHHDVEHDDNGLAWRRGAGGQPFDGRVRAVDLVDFTRFEFPLDQHAGDKPVDIAVVDYKKGVLEGHGATLQQKVR